MFFLQSVGWKRKKAEEPRSSCLLPACGFVTPVSHSGRVVCRTVEGSCPSWPGLCFLPETYWDLKAGRELANSRPLITACSRLGFNKSVAKVRKDVGQEVEEGMEGTKKEKQTYPDGAGKKRSAKDNTLGFQKS